MTRLLVLEDKFNAPFFDDEVGEMRSLSLILRILRTSLWRRDYPTFDSTRCEDRVYHVRRDLGEKLGGSAS